MSKKIDFKLIGLILAFIAMLIVLWIVVYKGTISKDETLAVTSENISEMDSWEGKSYKDATIYIDDVAYNLKDLNYDSVVDVNKVVKVVINNDEEPLKGYIAIDETISVPEVVILNDSYAKVLVPRYGA